MTGTACECRNPRLSAAVPFAVGVYSSVTPVGDWRKNGLKMVAIGLGAAATAGSCRLRGGWVGSAGQAARDGK
jgi:hypothetical protein